MSSRPGRVGRRAGARRRPPGTPPRHRRSRRRPPPVAVGTAAQVSSAAVTAESSSTSGIPPRARLQEAPAGSTRSGRGAAAASLLAAARSCWSAAPARRRGPRLRTRGRDRTDRARPRAARWSEQIARRIDRLAVDPDRLDHGSLAARERDVTLEARAQPAREQVSVGSRALDPDSLDRADPRPELREPRRHGKRPRERDVRDGDAVEERRRAARRRPGRRRHSDESTTSRSATRRELAPARELPQAGSPRQRQNTGRSEISSGSTIDAGWRAAARREPDLDHLREHLARQAVHLDVLKRRARRDPRACGPARGRGRSCRAGCRSCSPASVARAFGQPRRAGPDEVGHRARPEHGRPRRPASRARSRASWRSISATTPMRVLVAAPGAAVAVDQVVRGTRAPSVPAS